MCTGAQVNCPAVGAKCCWKMLLSQGCVQVSLTVQVAFK